MKKSTAATKKPSFTKTLKSWSAEPTVKYASAGVATILLGGLAYKLFKKYPAISEFITTNYSAIGAKITGAESELQ